MQPRVFVAVTEETKGSKYEEQHQADYEEDNPGTEAFVTVSQPGVLPLTGQTVA